MPFPNSAEATRPGWQTIVLFLFTLAATGLCVAVFFPFLPAITWAIALAVATRTPYDWLRRHMRNETLTAVVGVLLVIVLIVIPAVFLIQSLGDRAVHLGSLIQSGAAKQWLQSLVLKHPRVEHLFQQIFDTVDLQQMAERTAGILASGVRGLLSRSISAVTQTVIMLFTLFFLFRDRREALRALRALVPLNESQTDQLLDRLTGVLAATLEGRLIIAIVQGCLGGLMFWILGVPEVLFWTVVMVLVAMIPSVGTALVWLPAAAYLLITGHWIKAIVLFCWGAFVIGTIDNLLYPTLVGSRMQLHTAPLFFSVLGGIALFGFSGIVLGPLVLTTLITLLQIWKNDIVTTVRET